MFTANVKTKFDHPDKHAEHLEKHREAAKKKLGDEVEMLSSRATSVPTDDLKGHTITLETTWGIAKPVAAPEPPPLPDPVKRDASHSFTAAT